MKARRPAPERPTFADCFGTNLVRHRRAAGMSQELLGELAALHRTAIGQLERGERVARTDTLVKLAAALGVDANSLLADIIWTPPRLDTGSFEFGSGREPESASRRGR